MTLRDFQDKDIELIKKWLKEPYVARWYTHPEAWIEEMENRKTRYSFIRHFIEEEDGRPIGFCQYYDFTKGGEDWNGTIPSEGSFSIDYMIGEPAFLGKGYGAGMVRQLTDRILSETGAERIIVQPEPGNSRSRNTLRSAGYDFDEKNDVFIVRRK